MDSWAGFFLLALVNCVVGDESLLVSCDMTDLDCLGQSTKLFLEKTSKGIKEYDIRPIDPWFISSLDVTVDEDMGLYFHYSNLTVTGLKNQKIYDFQIDVVTNSVVLKTKADLIIEGNLNIELKNKSKTFSGIYRAETTSVGAAQYGYNLKFDTKGILHFEVGPETIRCESINDPIVTLDPEFANAIQKDPDAMVYKPAYEARKTALRKKTICKIVELCYVDVIHNIKAAAKVLPASAFFKNITPDPTT